MVAPMSAPSRDLSIDTLRAMACIALVSFHVVGYSPNSGMELPTSHWLHQVNGALVDMRMPLFSFLSGFVFVTLERNTRSLWPTLAAKARRLLLPMLSVGVTFWLARAAMGMDQQPLWSIAILPFGHFWFLQATFLIMVCFLTLGALFPGHSIAVARGLLILSALTWILGVHPDPNLFSVAFALHLMPFFMLGYLCARGPMMQLHRGVGVVTLVGLVCLGAALASDLLSLPLMWRRSLGVVIGIVSCMTLLSIAPRHAGLARLGSHSYAIYLFHVFFTAGTRDVVLRVVPDIPDAMLWMLMMGAGLVGPVLVCAVLMRHAVLGWLCLGYRFPTGLRPVAYPVSAQRA